MKNIIEKENAAKTTELIPNQWYPIFLSNKLKEGSPISLKRMGKQLVLWREKSGQARAALAACPHRGADLGLGKVIDGNLQCKYHGFCFSGSGRCVAVPCEGKTAKIPNSLDLTMVELKEADGFLWYWHREENEVNKTELPALPKIKNADARMNLSKCQTWEMEWDISLSRVIEGMMDIHHLPFAHSPWIPGNLTRLDPYEVKVEEGTIYTRGFLGADDVSPGDKNPGIVGTINISFPSLMHMVFGQGEKPNKGADYDTISGFEMTGACTPIDENKTWIGVYYQQSYFRVPFLSQIFNFLALQFDLKLIQPDDYQLLKSSNPASTATGSNHLVHADLGIAEWHRMQRKALAKLNYPEEPVNAPSQIQKIREEETATNSRCGI